MKDLTKAEEQIMLLLWEREGAFVRELLEDMPEPKPAYNTVSTIVRILVQKGFLKTEPHGKSHKYLPVISKEQYSSFATRGLLKSYFNGSLAGLVSFFTEDKGLDAKELDEILEIIEKNKS